MLSGDDPPAKHNYQFQIPWLLRKRRENAAPTWIVLGPALDSVAFKSCYGGLCKPLATCLAEGFIKLPLRWEDKR